MEAITTVVYYTSNREDEVFEEKIRAKLVENCGGLPIVSVSQKPINLGKNYWVGDVGVCEDNLFRQILTGCMAARTPFVTFAEADTLYPPDYFTYRPAELNKRYWFEGVWILYPFSKDLQNNFYAKGRSDCAHMAGREYLISILERRLAGRKMWHCNPEPMPKYNRRTEWPTIVEVSNPIVSFKTGQGMRPKTQTSRVPVPSLPYWGKAEDLRKEYCGL
jgi:hypothetical protein